MKRFLVLVVIAFVAAGCSGGSKQGPSGSSLSETDVRLRILDALDGQISFCGPPVIQAGAPVVPRTEFRWIRSQRSVYIPILRHEGLMPGSLTDADVSDVVRVYKEIQSISLKRVGGTYAFNAYTPGTAYEHLVSGSVDASGGVTVQHRTIGRQNCPICLARSVMIATPHGPVPVTRIHDGMIVWSTNRSGHRIRAFVLETRRLRAIGELLRVALADGRSVMVSAGHPTANGRLVGELAVGDPLDGSTIDAINEGTYNGFTYDLLPSGPTHTYFADRVLLGSTLGN